MQQLTLWSVSAEEQKQEAAERRTPPQCRGHCALYANDLQAGWLIAAILSLAAKEQGGWSDVNDQWFWSKRQLSSSYLEKRNGRERESQNHCSMWPREGSHLHCAKERQQGCKQGFWLIPRVKQVRLEKFWYKMKIWQADACRGTEMWSRLAISGVLTLPVIPAPPSSIHCFRRELVAAATSCAKVRLRDANALWVTFVSAFHRKGWGWEGQIIKKTTKTKNGGGGLQRGLCLLRLRKFRAWDRLAPDR